MSKIDVQTVKQDAEQLQAAYKATLADLESAWRAAYLERDKDAAQNAQRRANDLQRRAGILAGRAEIARRALLQLERTADVTNCHKLS